MHKGLLDKCTGAAYTVAHACARQVCKEVFLQPTIYPSQILLEIKCTGAVYTVERACAGQVRK